MNKYEFKLTFETDIKDAPNLLVEVVKVLEDKLKGKIQHIKPTFTILNNKKMELHKENPREKIRIIEKFSEDLGWVTVEMKELKDGDIFIIFDNGEMYFDPETHNNIWIVKGEPFIQNGIWTVNTIY